jgi:Zn finger protein HypA/HybF involved in hydrogenase expression
MNNCKIENCIRKAIAKQMCQPHYDRLRLTGTLELRPGYVECQTCAVVFKTGSRGNLARFCPECRADRHRKLNRTNKFLRRVRSQYGITPVQYFMMHDMQGGVCKICGGQATGRGFENNRLSIDHNHETGEVRGLLCTLCNAGIGHFKEDVALMKKAINYLEETNGKI